MSGKMMEYYTGIHIIDIASKKILSDTTKTAMYMRKYTDQEINFYMDHCNEEYKQHAPAFNPEKYYSMSFINKVVGEPWGAVATPLGRIMEMLQEL
jgi:predicted house-cleaning NTP pyrophosphatase (Maf/HAM1 superfamily)